MASVGLLLVLWSVAAGAADGIRSGSGTARGFGIGLYKDGRLVEDLQRLDVADLTDSEPSKSLRLQSSRAPARPRLAAPRLSDATVRRNAELSQAATAASRLQTLLETMDEASGDSRTLQGPEFAKLADDFRNGQERVREVMALVVSDLEVRALPRRIREKYETLLARHDARMADFESVFSDLANGRPGAGGRLRDFMRDALFLREPSLPDEPTLTSHVEPAPRMSREAADLALVASEVSRSLVPAARRATQSTRGESSVSKRSEARALASSNPNGDSPLPADLAATPEVQLTQAVLDKASALGHSALALYEFVRNSVGFQPYLGSRKGADFTLSQSNGNDTDQASLLIALLRASGIPARYARGTVEMTPQQAMNLTGVDDPATAASILTTAGLNGVAIVDGQDVIAVRSTRVWVLAYVPYSDYRGAGTGTQGKAWVPLDPSFKAWSVTPGQDVLQSMGWNVDTFLADHIATFHPLSPIEQLESDIQAWLDLNQPGTSVADIERRLSVGAQSLGLLPASLPYQVLSVTGQFAELEDSKRYKVRFHLHDSGSTFIDHTVRLSDLAGHRLTIGYVGATPEDQAVIDSYGSIYETPPGGVEVKPVLEIDGTVVATGSGSIGLGYTHDSDMHFTAPTGANNQQPIVQNTITAGNSQAIAFDTFLDVPADSLEFGTFGTGPAVHGLLHPTAAEYLHRVDEGMRDAEGWMRMVSIQDVSEAIVESSVSVSYSFGVPVSFEWTGMIVDADRRIVGPFSAGGNAGQGVPYMKLTGYDGSNMENRLFEDLYGQEAVSTIKILQLASDAGVGLCTITTSIAGQCPGFAHAAATTSAVQSALAQGHHVTIPKAPITVGQWVGTGYIDMEPGTGAAGYIISGGISGHVIVSGGATVQTWPIILACAPSAGTFRAEVTSPAENSPHPDAVYCPNSETISFTLKLKYDCQGRPGQQMLVSRTTSLSTKQIVDAFGPGVYTISVSGAPPDPGKHPRKLALAGIEFVTPAGDPVASPVDGGDGSAAQPDGSNEFKFGTAGTGVLKIRMKAKITPTGIADVIKNDVRFQVDGIGASSLAWENPNASGRPDATGDHLTATAVFTTLPAANADFGKKKARVVCVDGGSGSVLQDEEEFEVFFDRDATNHPQFGPYLGPRPKNWFYYWSQVAGGGHRLVYGGASPGSTVAEVKAMTDWSYATAPDKSRIDLYDGVVGKFRAYGVGEEFSGIDQFASTVVHEAEHVNQIARADGLVATGTAGTPWRFGWSFNQGGNHNHWTIGPDAQPGVATADDDMDGTVDNLRTDGPGELGRGDDVDLTHPTSTSRNWAAVWAIPSPKPYPSEIESEAINAADNALNEHDYARLDWAAPGKNHATVNKHDD